MNVPFEPVVQHLFDDFKHEIDKFNTRDATWTPSLALALLRLRLACKQSKMQVDSCVMLNHYLFYVYAFLSSSPCSTPMRFNDGTFGISLLTGSYGRGPDTINALDSMPTSKLLIDRNEQALKLSNQTENSIVTLCSGYIPTDLPAGVSPRVAALVGRTRFLVQRMRMIRPACFSPCGVCKRPHVASATFVSASGHDAVESDDEDGDEVAEGPVASPSQYWASALPGTPTLPPSTSFCCLTCELAFKDELEEATPVSVERLAYEEDYELRRKTALDRVLALSRHVITRNQQISRHLRATRRSRTTFTISEATIKRMRRDLITKLNIDTALVLAAASIATSRSLSRMRRLPGGVQWRDHDWTRALSIVKIIYKRARDAKTKRGKLPMDDILIQDQLNLPKWVNACCDAALNIFPLEHPM